MSKNNYFIMRDWIIKKRNEWNTNTKKRLKYNNNLKEYSDALAKKVDGALIKLYKSFKSEKRDTPRNLKIVFKSDKRGEIKQYNQFRILDQHALVVDILEYSDKENEPHYYISFPKSRECDVYFETSKSLEDYHDIWIIKEALVFENINEHIFISYNSTYIK